MTQFSPDVVRAVAAHMNDDHRGDNLLIVRAFVDAGASEAQMTGLDAQGGSWSYVSGGEQRSAVVPWPIPVESRGDIRTAVVVLYEDACHELGVEPRKHGG